MKKKKLSLFSIFFTFFVDNLGWSIVFPIFAPLFLDHGNKIFDPDVSAAFRTTLLGFFLAAFPLAQFFGAPILGELSDRFGRKKALLLSIVFTLIGYVISAISIKGHFLSLLFISRIITGIFAGNLSVCLSAISDLCKNNKEKLHLFGYLAVLAGFSFIVGAYIGGKFSDVKVASLFTPAFPMWIAAGLSGINVLFVLWGFEESSSSVITYKLDIWESVHNVQQALKARKIKVVFIVYFLFVFGWTILFQFMPVLVIQKFSFTNSKIGDLAAFMGIGWAIGAGFLSKTLVRAFSYKSVLEWMLILFAPLCAGLFFLTQLPLVYITLALCVLIGGIAWPACNALISNMAEQKMQGKVLGMMQSVQSLAMALSPAIGGFLDHIYAPLPFLCAAGASFVAAIIYLGSNRA